MATKTKTDPLAAFEKRLEEIKKSGEHAAVYMIAVPTDDSGNN